MFLIPSSSDANSACKAGLRLRAGEGGGGAENEATGPTPGRQGLPLASRVAKSMLLNKDLLD